jgi:hypothetical protein
MTTNESVAGRGRSAVGVGALTIVCGVAVWLVAVSTAVAAAPAVMVVSASTAMSGTTTFTSYKATASCPTGTTLVGGGDTLTRAGVPVPNVGAVTLGLFPSDTSGSNAADGATSPGSWTAVSGYSGEAPGLDTVTSYAVCASNVTSATIVRVATTATNTLGPVTAVCPSGASLVGGGGGYNGFVPGTNTKVRDSYPSDASGDLPVNGTTNPNAWTVRGNSNSATSGPTTAVALCATDTSAPTVVASAVTNNDHPVGSGGVPGGSSVMTTVSCPGGTTLLAGGSHISSSQNGNVGGPGNGGQGVHVIGDFPSDGSGNPIGSGTAGAWTVIAQNGGQNLDTLDVQAFGLCDTKVAPSLSTQASPGVPLGGAVTDTATLAGGNNPTGTMTFNLYGPGETPNCAGTPVTTSTVNVSGNGSYASASFTPPGAGTYYWTASYSGDTNNAAATSSCGASGESVHVAGAGEQLDHLLSLVTGIGPANSLAAKVQAAIDSRQADSTNGACGALAALINEAQAQNDKHLTAAQVDAIVSAATSVRNTIGC